MEEEEEEEEGEEGGLSSFLPPPLCPQLHIFAYLSSRPCYTDLLPPAAFQRYCSSAEAAAAAAAVLHSAVSRQAAVPWRHHHLPWCTVGDFYRGGAIGVT